MILLFTIAKYRFSKIFIFAKMSDFVLFMKQYQGAMVHMHAVAQYFLAQCSDRTVIYYYTVITNYQKFSEVVGTLNFLEFYCLRFSKISIPVCNPVPRFESHPLKNQYLRGKKNQNNFQERDFLRDLKFPSFLCSYVAGKKGRDFQIT